LKKFNEIQDLKKQFEYIDFSMDEKYFGDIQ
jgi:hypothetical protein